MELDVLVNAAVTTTLKKSKKRNKKSNDMKMQLPL